MKDPVMQKLKSLEQRVDNILKLLQAERASGDFITAEQAEKLFGYKPRTLRAWRVSGKITQVRCANGRKFQFSRTELESFYTA